MRDDPRRARSLSQAEFFPRLEALDISSPGGDGALGPRAGTLLTRGRSLVSLKLYDCKLGDEGLEALANSPGLENLREIELIGNPITPRGALALARSPHLPRLRRVYGLTLSIDRELRIELERRFELAW